ncbi:MAG: hypothetical protein ACJ74W_20410 [Pyrinomonadaceae bacterium]
MNDERGMMNEKQFIVPRSSFSVYPSSLSCSFRRFVPTACAPTMAGGAFIDCLFGGRGQTAHDFALFVAEF